MGVVDTFGHKYRRGQLLFSLQLISNTGDVYAYHKTSFEIWYTLITYGFLGDLVWCNFEWFWNVHGCETWPYFAWLVQYTESKLEIFFFVEFFLSIKESCWSVFFLLQHQISIKSRCLFFLWVSRIHKKYWIAIALRSFFDSLISSFLCFLYVLSNLKNKTLVNHYVYCKENQALVKTTKTVD